ncbi:hypothetical protein F2Q70_00016021 [Brassica cretica]|uniref:Uncharacterized protein n=1 Tax=Brassica cretica TaxID=69181 RepID=A0A8S9I463_BRACR|nr:hypothetical protein F2Q70_00016021 [Brassica cretica]
MKLSRLPISVGSCTLAHSASFMQRPNSSWFDYIKPGQTGINRSTSQNLFAAAITSSYGLPLASPRLPERRHVPATSGRYEPRSMLNGVSLPRYQTVLNPSLTSSHRDSNDREGSLRWLMVLPWLCSGEAPSPKTRSCSDHHEPITKPSSSPPPWSATRDVGSRATSFPHGHISFSSKSQDQTVSAQLRHRRDLQPREAVSSNGYFCSFCNSGPSSSGCLQIGPILWNVQK